MVAVVAILVGLRVRRWRRAQIARDNAVHYYSTPGLGCATVDGGGEARKKESAAIDYYEDTGRGCGGERVPGREPHYTAFNMDTVTKSEHETLHKM